MFFYLSILHNTCNILETSNEMMSMAYIIQLKGYTKVLHMILISVILNTGILIKANSLTIEDALKASLIKTENNILNTDIQTMTGYQSSSWLVAFPTVSFNYMDSQDVGQTSEQELSINLPLKSPFSITLNDRLSALNQQARILRTEQKRLYFSGIIREVLWSYRLTSLQISQSERKRRLLLKLFDEYGELFKANEINHYTLLLIEQELAQQSLKLLSLEQQQQQWLQRYINITGLEDIPDIIEETEAQADFSLNQHPSLRLLDNQWQQQKLIIDSQTNGNNEPWTVSVVKKTINNGIYDENQIGINLEIPITFSKINRQVDINARTDINAKYYADIDKMRLELYSQWTLLKNQQTNIQTQQKLLTQSAVLSKKIAKQLTALHKEGEISHEIWLRRYMQTIDSEFAMANASLKYQQIQSMLNQAAGVSL